MEQKKSEGKRKSIAPCFFICIYNSFPSTPPINIYRTERLSVLGFNNLCPLVRRLEQFISTSDTLLLESSHDHLRDMFKIVGRQCQYCRSRPGEADSQEARVGLRSYRGEYFWESWDLGGSLVWWNGGEGTGGVQGACGTADGLYPASLGRSIPRPEGSGLVRWSGPRAFVG